jgi:3-deoxy-manno-octulosonate cytidylyltransferase (CMP-KDO synthetase)
MLNNNSFYVIIPARRNSTRLANKMLLEINHVPLIIHTAKNAMKSNAKLVIVATDDDDIYNACQKYGINVIMTSKNHSTGTDRLAEAVQLFQLKDDDIIVNVQGDEPLIDYNLINNLANFLHDKKVAVASIAHYINDVDEIENHNIVKVVLDKNSNALYFSRSVIPYNRDKIIYDKYLRHFGMYVYTVKFLKNYQNLSHCELENVEKLEQLRILYNDIKLAILVTSESIASGVDTLDDYLVIKKLMENGTSDL